MVIYHVAMLLLGIAELILLLKIRRLSMHEIKQAVKYMGPELLLRNAPPPPVSNFVHFFFEM